MGQAPPRYREEVSELQELGIELRIQLGIELGIRLQELVLLGERR
jgi:hypothetical protein